MRQLVVLGCALLLAACAAETGGSRDALVAAPAPQAGASDRNSGAGVMRPPLPEPRPDAVREAAPSESSGASGPGQAAALRAVDVDALSGADRDSLRTILGPADEIRARPPGEVWIYREAGCSVELYLFPQISASQYAVLGHKVLPATLAEEERTSCLTKLASRTRAS